MLKELRSEFLRLNLDPSIIVKIDGCNDVILRKDGHKFLVPFKDLIDSLARMSAEDDFWENVNSIESSFIF